MSERYYQFPNNYPADVHDKVAHLRERAEALSKIANQLDGCGVYAHSALTEIAALYSSFAGCMDLLAQQLPFKAGDRVRLVKAPKCEGGWAGSKHFLIVGAIGTVKEVSIDYLMRDWSVFVEFDDESWIASTDACDGSHKKGDIVPAKDKHVYGFKPSSIDRLDAPTRLTDEDREALRFARRGMDTTNWMEHQRHDPLVKEYVDNCAKAAAVLDRILGTKEGV